MTRQKFKHYVGWGGLIAFVIGIAAGWPKLGAVGVVMLLAWFLSQPITWLWLAFGSHK